MNNLRLNLLGDIIHNTGFIINKYSLALNNLRVVIELEKNEKNDSKLSKELFTEFQKILTNMDNISENTPLLILEQYYYRNYNNLNKILYIEYKDNAYEINIKDLFLLLEDFYYKIFSLSVRIADYYNLELKLKKTTNLDNVKYL